MKICVVTPYFQESVEWLVQANASVKSQTVEARHILVCDGSAPAAQQSLAFAPPAAYRAKQ